MDDFDFDELNDIINQSIEELEGVETSKEKLEITDYKFCDDCNVLMESDINNSLTCKICGFIKNISTENGEYEPSMTGYNTNSNFHIPIKCIGANSFQYQKQLRNSTSQYSIVQETNLRRKLERLNFRSTSIFIPKNIIERVVSQYKLIRETDKIHRGDIFNGIIGSLIYYECLTAGIIRKHKEISDWYGITENDLSKGDKIVRVLEEKKIIQLPIYENNNMKYIESYLKRAGVDINYKYFMNKLLDIIEDKKIGNHNARLSTKVSAILFIVIISSKEITEEEFSAGRLEPTPTLSADYISKEFSISISTFKSFYSDINKNKNIEDIKQLCSHYGMDIPDKLPRKKKTSI